MRDDSLTRLAQAGVPVSQLTRAQREVVLGLTEAEFGVLTGVLRRISTVAADVEGQDLVVML
jgi:hypothetical protein